MVMIIMALVISKDHINDNDNKMINICNNSENSDNSSSIKRSSHRRCSVKKRCS